MESIFIPFLGLCRVIVSYEPAKVIEMTFNANINNSVDIYVTDPRTRTYFNTDLGSHVGSSIQVDDFIIFFYFTDKKISNLNIHKLFDVREF